MNELPLMAATAWAQAHAGESFDPVEFGANVARVYVVCQVTEHHAGDEKAMAVSLAALSVRPEVLKLIAQLSALSLRPQAVMRQQQTDSAGAE